MLINIDNKKIHKNFMNFNEEETWLQKQLEEGWMLDRYSNDFEEGTYYTFRKIMEYERKRWIFKVDFREFDEQEEYDDYIDVFKESGWSTFSKKGYSKHIFYTNANNPNQDIFSDVDSYIEREKRVMHASFKNGIIFTGFLIASIVLYLLNESAFFVGSGLFSGFAVVKYLTRYLKHRNTFKSMQQ